MKIQESAQQSPNQQYDQMANLTSGSTSTTSSFTCHANQTRSSFRSNLKTNDLKLTPNEPEPNPSPVYNFPWDFKLKPNPLQVQLPNQSSSSLATVPPPLPSVPPPQTPKTTEIQDESQYCAPWDLKLQEEMLKLMAQQQQGQPNAQQTPSLQKSEDKSNPGSFKRNESSSSSIKLKNSSNDLTSLSTGSTAITTLNTDLEGSEYSPPWEHKQSILFQQLALSTSTSTSNSSKQSSNIQMPAPLATSSASSTLTTQTSSTNQTNAMSALFNKLSLTRLSTRSSTSSSSSTRSSTSSLSASSPPSMPPPPLPPPLLPPPPPPPSSSLPTEQANKCLHRCLSGHQHQPQQQLQQCQHSPRLSHRQLSQTTATTSCGFMHVQSVQNTCSTNSQLNSSACAQHLAANNSSNYLNDKNKFSSWTNANCQPVVFDTLASNGSGSGSAFDETKQIFRQNRAGSSHHFPSYPQQHVIQQQQQQHQQFQTIATGDIQVSALPLTSLVFSHSNSLPLNLIPHQQQQQGIMHMSSPSTFSELDRQPWFHGRITRKHAENMLNNKPIGSFLVRQSESGNSNDYSLSLVSGSGCVHMRICMKNGEFILGQCSQPFTSIVKMIDHYGRVEVPIKGAQHVKLCIPISPSG